MDKLAVIIGAVFILWGIADYALDTYRGVTQPNRVSFALWFVAVMIAAIAALSEGVTWAGVPIFADGLGLLSVLAASAVNKQAYWKLGPFDWSCGVLSLLALILWRVTMNANVAIMFAILGDFCACLPTIKKSRTHPDSETSTLYSMSVFSAATCFVAMKEWSFTEIAFPAYLFAVNTLLWGLVFSGQKGLRKTTSPH